MEMDDQLIDLLSNMDIIAEEEIVSVNFINFWLKFQIHQQELNKAFLISCFYLAVIQSILGKKSDT